MYIAIVTDVTEDGQALTINNLDTDEPQMFDCVEDIQELKYDHSLMACDWWAFNCETGRSTALN